MLAWSRLIGLWHRKIPSEIVKMNHSSRLNGHGKDTWEGAEGIRIGHLRPF